jgi:hypothetical protein
VVDILSRILYKAVEVGLIKGLGNDITQGGVISLQYVDDTILFVNKEETSARNLKWILTYFELMSGMTINYHKSELVPINVEATSEVLQYVDIFGCPIGTLPIRYLAIPLHFAKLRREVLEYI